MPDPAPNPGNGTQVQPPPAGAAPSPPPRSADSGDDGDDGDPKARVPSHRLKAEADKRRAAEERVATLAGELATSKADAEAKGRALADAQTMHAQETHLLGLGIGTPNIRRFFRREYGAAVADLPADKRPEFGAWLEANKTDPLYAPHFAAVDTRRAATDDATDGADLVKILRKIVDTEDQTQEAKATAILALLQEAEVEDEAPADPLAPLVEQLAKRLGVKPADLGKGKPAATQAANPNGGTRGAAAKTSGTHWTGQAIRDAMARNGGRLPAAILQDILADAESQNLVTDSWRKRIGK